MEEDDNTSVQYVAFMTDEQDKHEQFHLISRVNTRQCVMCERHKPDRIGYFEPNKRSGLDDYEMVRVWYFICTGCLVSADPMAIDNQILSHMLGMNN